MMRILATALIVLNCFSGITAQVKHCDVERRLEDAFLKNNYNQFKDSVSHYLASQPILPRTERWLQVVVHVVTDAPQSIPYARIAHQIDVLNNDFAKRGENIKKLNEEFTSLAADTEIRFCLADIDPNGNPTDGVTYTMTNEQNIALKRDDFGRYVLYYDELGGKTGWDPTRYINIWVAEFGNGLIGYGSAPGTAPDPKENGVVIDPLYFGAARSADDPSINSGGHTLTHEMGHFLGLLHIWGEDDDSCTDSDEVEDTPNAEGPYLGCPSGTQVSCGVSNMYENFMDFTDDRCLAAFTHGQAMRMQAVLDLFYPAMQLNSPCSETIDSLDTWWQELVWTYDHDSRAVILFHPTLLTDVFEVDVFSVDGRMIMEDVISEQQAYRIILHQHPPGIYFIRIKNGNEQHIRKIFIY